MAMMGDLSDSAAVDAESQPTPSSSFSPLPESELQTYTEKYPFAAEPTYFTRPNGYYGPASTWRSWTEKDRVTAENVLSSRAQNLGVHLYNAFALKEKARSAGVWRLRTRSRSRSRAKSADNEDSENLFTPPDLWTAWPLSAWDVPRQCYGDTTERSNLSDCNNVRPSANLENALIAITLRHAKERWDQRPWEPEEAQSNRPKRDWKAEVELTKQQLVESGLLEEEDIEPSKREIDDQEIDGAEDLSSFDDSGLESSPEADLPADVRTFSSQAFAAAESSSSEEEPEASTDEDDRPVFSADDDQSRRILAPSRRHLLSKLDDLLLGLHKARFAYAVQGLHSRPRSRSRVESTDDERFVRSSSRAASRKRGRKRKRSVSPENNSSQEYSKSRSRAGSAKKQFGAKGGSLGLRDWSDVLGMAALTGWKTETVARASERCAKLFGQNMVFRTFYEGNSEAQDKEQVAPYFEKEYAYVPQAASDRTRAVAHENPASSEDHQDSGTDLRRVRVSSPCDRCRSRRLRCAPPESVEVSSDTTSVACAPCASIGDPMSPCSGIFIKLRPFQDQPSPSSSRICPYPDCPRHVSGKRFAKRYQLRRHLENVHGCQDSSFPSSPSKAATNFTLPVRQKSGHEGAGSCPIPSCPQSRYVYARSTRLYDHIRHAHPDFDLDEYKKLMGRGKRGKYDRSMSQGRVRKNVQAEDDVNPISGDEYGSALRVQDSQHEADLSEEDFDKLN